IASAHRRRLRRSSPWRQSWPATGSRNQTRSVICGQRTASPQILLGVLTARLLRAVAHEQRRPQRIRAPVGRPQPRGAHTEHHEEDRRPDQVGVAHHVLEGPPPQLTVVELGTHHWGVLRKITTPLPARASQPRSSSSSRVAARSAHTRASTTAGTAHTQWCPQDTGEQNSATYPTTTAAATSCPARRRRHATYAIASPTS